MAIPVARVYLKVVHSALRALLPTPPKWKMLRTPPPCLASILPKPPLANAKPSRADIDERWDAHKAKPACLASLASSSLGPRSADTVRRSAGHGSSLYKNATSPPPKPGRADSMDRWDAHKKAGSRASSSSSSVSSSLAISRATSAERWDVHKKRRPPQAAALDDGESSSIGSNDDMDTKEEEIIWKPRAMYAGPGFVGAAPKSSMLPMPTAFLVGVA